MTALRVLRPGLFSLVVDAGRPNSRSLGVPVGGPADALNLAIGNALLGNPPFLAGLEVTLVGPTLLLPAEAPGPVALVLHGAPFELFVQRGLEREPQRPGVTFTLEPGCELHVGGTAEGCRGYLCVAGGWHTPVVLGSRSAFQPLRAGDELPCQPGRTGRRFVQPCDPRGREPDLLRVLPGGQASWFADGAFASTGEEPGLGFRVGTASNRMGIRLEGPRLPLEREMASEPVCPGTVQVTREGGCIILGVDGQTIGGYPKIAQVISADLDRVGQLRPGREVRFHWVSQEEAEEAARQRRRFLEEWVGRLRCAARVE